MFSEIAEWIECTAYFHRTVAIASPQPAVQSVPSEFAYWTNLSVMTYMIASSELTKLLTYRILQHSVLSVKTKWKRAEIHSEQSAELLPISCFDPKAACNTDLSMIVAFQEQ